MPNNSIIVIGTDLSGQDIIDAAILLDFEVLTYNPAPREDSSPNNLFIDSSVIPNGHFNLPVILGSFAFDINDELRFDLRTIENRRHLMALAEAAGFWNWTSIIHPSAVVSPSSTIGKNVFISANSTIAYNTKIGDNVFVNRNVAIGHNVTIGDFSRIGPGTVIPGHVILKEGVTTGPGVITINNIIIEKNVAVAAGSVVTRDIAEGLLVFGSPATSLRPFRIRLKKRLKRISKKILSRLGLLKAAKLLRRRLKLDRPYI